MNEEDKSIPEGSDFELENHVSEDDVQSDYEELVDKVYD